MRRMLVSLLSGYLVFTAGLVLVAAPGQGQAGVLDPSRVWVQNRGSGEAVPVVIEPLSPDMPLPVQVTAMPAMTVAGVVPVQQARQVWEYQALAVSPAEDPVTMLMEAGGDGWEVTGVQIPSPSGITLILKRLR
jgi:hypothetical protein